MKTFPKTPENYSQIKTYTQKLWSPLHVDHEVSPQMVYPVTLYCRKPIFPFPEGIRDSLLVNLYSSG